MTSEEKVESLHARMELRKQRRERQKTSLIGTACACLSICLVLLVFYGGTSHLAGSGGTYSGAMMLFEDAGGYVLTAVVAFMAGVIVTAVIMWRRIKRNSLSSKKDTEPREG